MITIHTGVWPTEELPQDGLSLRDPVNYPLVRRCIQEALAQKEDLKVFVLDRVCDDWFWDLFEYHGEVDHRNFSPAERLKHKLSVSALPTDLATQPKVIIDLDLLSLPAPTERVVDVWRWILAEILGSVWVAEEPSPEHLSQLVSWYVENSADPILEPWMTRAAQAWTERASGKLRSAYARFLSDPWRNAYSLVTARALDSYDRELREQWLTDLGLHFHELADVVDMVEMPAMLPRQIRHKLNQRVHTHWNTRLNRLSN